MSDLSAHIDGSVEVDWDDDQFANAVSDVTDATKRVQHRWGLKRRSNPQRPVIDPGSGMLHLQGDRFVPGRSSVLSDAQLRGRHRFRLLHNPRSGSAVPDPVEGWVLLVDRPTRSSVAGRESVFSLVGLRDDSMRESTMVNQVADPLSSGSSDFADLVEDAVGQTVPVTAPVVNLGVFNFAGRRGEFVAQIARTLAASPYAGRRGAVSLAAAGSVTPSALRISGADLAIFAVSVSTDTAQIYNQLVARAAGTAADDASQQIIEVPMTVTGDGSLPLAFSGQFAPLGPNWTYSVADPIQIELQHPGMRFQRSGQSVYRFTGLSGPEEFRPPAGWIRAGCTASAALNGTAVTATVTDVEAVTAAVPFEMIQSIAPQWDRTRNVELTIEAASTGDTLTAPIPGSGAAQPNWSLKRGSRPG